MKTVLENLMTTCLNGFENPNYKGDTVGTFRSHFDWHSSVHGHWMLLSSSRLTDNSEVARKVLNRLNPRELEAARRYVLANPEFELPYGQSWFLLLFFELEKAGFAREIEHFRNETLDRVLWWLEKTEFVEREVNPYQSWLMTYFLLKKAHIQTHGDRIKKLDEKFDQVRNVRDDENPRDFFSAESLFGLLKERPKAEFVWDKALRFYDRETFKNSHEVGKIITKSWSTPKCNPDAHNLTFASVKNFMADTRLWKDDFNSVAHWIPQFLYMGIWLGLGEP